MKNPYEIIKHPVSTEKAVRKMETENVLIFIVDKSATKKTIKWAVEKAFDAKVINVNTMITRDTKKKAYVKLSPDTPAVEVTSALGLV